MYDLAHAALWLLEGVVLLLRLLERVQRQQLQPGLRPQAAPLERLERLLYLRHPRQEDQHAACRVDTLRALGQFGEQRAVHELAQQELQ